MSYVHISRITPSKFGDGDRWRLEIDGEWYDAYLTPEAADLQPGVHEVEFKTSPKTGKAYAVAIDGRFRTGINGGPRAPQAPQAAPRTTPGPVASPRMAGSALPAEAKPGAKDMWIMATSIMQAMIAQGGVEMDSLVALAREAANAARAAARVFDGAPVDAVRAAIRPAPVAPQAGPLGDPDDPRNAGPDFDDDIPF